MGCGTFQLIEKVGGLVGKLVGIKKEVLVKEEPPKKVEPVSTNIIIFSLIEEIDQNYFINKMKENNIFIISLGNDKLRIVTHRDYTDNHHNYFLSTIKKIKF